MKQSIFRVTLALTVFIVVLTSIAVSLSYHLADNDDPLRWQALGTSLVSVLIAALLLFLYSRRLLVPIRQIMSALNAFRKGGPLSPLPTERQDELGVMARAIDGMIRDVERRSALSEASRVKLEALFQVVQEGIVITDQNGLIESVNPSLCRMFGYEEQELLGQSNLMLMPEPYASHHDKYMRDSLRTGTLGFMGMYRDLTALRKDGSIFPVVINVETLALGDKQLFAAIIRDITKEKEHESDLLNAKMRAEVANEAKSNFLSMMSHEIRTPLNGVMGVLQILETEIQDHEQREFLSVASRSATNLLHIVNDILDISKAESGSMELEVQEFNLRDLLEDCIELYIPRLMDSGIALRFYIPMDLPSCLVGDSFRLQQMINNLLSNAIKFTERGEIGLLVNWEPRGEAEISIRIDVTDTGVGIPADKLGTIFEPFVQADPAISRSYGGTGLGLSIVKRIATLMGGRVWANSEPGVGSSFHLYLHLPVAEHPAPESSAPWLAGRRMLFVGGHQKRSMLLEYLTYHQAQVEELSPAQVAQNGLSGAENYDVVIMECNDDTGLPTLNRLADQYAGKGVRFICLHRYLESHSPELHEAVFDLTEPVLSRTLEGLFSFLEQQPGTVPAPVQSDHEGGNMPRILLVEDNPVNQMVAKSMLSKIGYEVVIANNGQEAVDEVKAGNVEMVLMDCHMPVMDGFEATRQIRDYLDGRSLPIVAMTADASVSDRERCIASGMDDHIPKPIKLDTLQSTIESWLKQ
jgi:PAS domain S-box-containing protein